MAYMLRKAGPDNMRYLWHAIAVHKETSRPLPKVMEYLITEATFRNNEAKDLIANAIHDGLVIECSMNSLKIPEKKDIKVNSKLHDWYCYECHISGNLQCCTQCLRTFHKECWRTDLDKPNTANKVVPNKRHVKKITKENEKFPESGSFFLDLEEKEEEDNPGAMQIVRIIDATDINDEETVEVLKLSLNEENEEDKEVIDALNLNSLSKNKKCNLKNDSSNIKCFFIGKKSEIRDEDDHLCSCCRLMKKSELHNPPNMTKADINYLLRFPFEKLKSWLDGGTDPIKWIMPEKYLDIFMKLCFKYPMSLEDIDNKLKNNEYSSLTEIQRDLMDLQHCMGILNGVGSYKYESTCFLLADFIYELSEIRLCPDCYRNSNEKASSDWFCKPCNPQHKLVFAKQAGYQYWPAKVVAVIGNKYDVRFFGKDHSRAVVNKTNVKPIDTSLQNLEIKKTVPFNKAMEELYKHQQLLNFPPEKILHETKEVLTIPITDKTGISNSNITNASSGRLRKTRSKSMFDAHKNSKPIRKRRTSYGHFEMDFEYENEESDTSDYVPEIKKMKTSTKKSKILSPDKRKNKGSKKSIHTKAKPKSNTPTTEQINEIENNQEPLVSSSSKMERLDKAATSAVQKFRDELSLAKTLNETKELALELFEDKAAQYHSKIQQINENHKKKISCIKKQQWCFKCEGLAAYNCCWNANYCSIECQEEDWENHKKECERIKKEKEKRN